MKFNDEGIPDIDVMSPRQKALVPFVVEAWALIDEQRCGEALRHLVWSIARDPAAITALNDGCAGAWLNQPLKELIYLGGVRADGRHTRPFLAQLESRLHAAFIGSDLAQKTRAREARELPADYAPLKEEELQQLIANAALVFCLELASRTCARQWFLSLESDGFFSYRARNTDFETNKTKIWGIAQKRPRLSLQRVPLTADIKASIRAYRRSECEFETDWDVLTIDAMARDLQGSACAYADATLFEPPSSDCSLHELFDTADVFDQDQADMAYDMLKQQPEGLLESLEMGYAILHIEHYEVIRQRRGQRLGARLLEVLIKRARRLAKCPIFVIVSVHPAQFPRIDFSTIDPELRTPYFEAVDRLTTYLQEARGTAPLFPPSDRDHTWTYRISTYARGEMEGLALLGRTLRERGITSDD